MKQIFSAILLILAFQSAWAIDIHTAKSQGLVGEAKSGYLAAVKSPASAEVKALIAEVNAKRKTEFQRTAQSTNTTIQQVSNRFYELAIKRTKAGHYYQDASGRWKVKG